MPGQAPPIEIRRLVPEDALALTRCFRRCYGTSYVVASFYDPAAIAERVREGSLRSVVAVGEAGEIVGHMGLTLRDPRARTVDAGNSIVDPAYRGREIVKRLALGVVTLCREGGFLGFHHYPTTAHPIMQRLAVQGGGVETGLLLEHVPAGTEYREIDGEPRTDRPAVVVVYQPLAPTPERRVHVPEHLAATIEGIYFSGDLPRAVSIDPAAGAPLTGETRLRSSLDVRRRSLRLEVERAGADLRDRVRERLGRFDGALSHADLSMNEPRIGAAVDALAELGFFFAAVLPEYLDGDVLRLQRIAADATPQPELASEHARDLLRAIESDRLRSASLAARAASS